MLGLFGDHEVGSVDAECTWTGVELAGCIRLLACQPGDEPGGNSVEDAMPPHIDLVLVLTEDQLKSGLFLVDGARVVPVSDRLELDGHGALVKETPVRPLPEFGVVVPSQGITSFVAAVVALPK